MDMMIKIHPGGKPTGLSFDKNCKSMAVDGGTDYLRRIGNCEDIEELSETKEDESDKS